jgi:hypothetical protein
MPAYIEPHTEHWFTALEAEQPGIARQIRQLLLTVGRTDACSLCGAVPARDYWIIARPTDPTPVPTLRLCEHCIGVRECVYQQRLVPVGRGSTVYRTS